MDAHHVKFLISSFDTFQTPHKSTTMQNNIHLFITCQDHSNFTFSTNGCKRTITTLDSELGYHISPQCLPGILCTSGGLFERPESSWHLPVHQKRVSSRPKVDCSLEVLWWDNNSDCQNLGKVFEKFQASSQVPNSHWSYYKEAFDLRQGDENVTEQIDIHSLIWSSSEDTLRTNWMAAMPRCYVM